MLFHLFTVTIMIVVQLSTIIQSYRIISGSDRRMVKLFGRWKMRAAGMGYFGSLNLVCVFLIFSSQTFLIGVLMLSITTLWIVYMLFSAKDYSRAAAKMGFLMIIMLLAFLGYPVLLSNLSKTNDDSVQSKPKPVTVCGSTRKP